MSDVKKKIHVLNTSGEFPDFVESFFTRYDSQIVESSDPDITFHIVIARTLSDVKVSDINESTLILVFEMKELSLSETNNIMNIELLRNSIIKKLVSRFFDDDTSLQVEQEFKNDVEHFESFKVTDQFQTGYYSDLVTLNSLRKDFNFVSIRLYLTYLMTFFSYLKQANQVRLPIDFDLAGDKTTFMIQAHCYAKDFKIESLKEAMKREDINNPAQGLIQASTEYCHFTDYYYVEKTSRLVITSLWIKSEKKILAASQGSLFKVFTQLSGSIGNTTKAVDKNLLSQAEASADDASKELPGKGYPLVASDKEGENSLDMSKTKVVMAGDLNKIVDYILNENDNGIVVYKKAGFDKEMIGWFLDAYPDKAIVTKLNDKNYEYILHCIKDDSFLVDMKQKLKPEDTAAIVDNVAQSVRRNLKDDYFVEELNEKRKEEGKEELNVAEVADKIAEELIEHKEEFKTVEDVAEETKKLISEKLEIPDKEVQQFVDKIMLESIQDFVDALEESEDNAKVDKKYVIKMMKVIQALKNKIITMENDGDDDAPSLAELAELRKKIGAHSAIIENKDKVIKELNLKIENLRSVKGDTLSEGDELDESEGLKSQVRSLESQLELYQERVSVLSSKLDKTGDKGDLLFKKGAGSGKGKGKGKGEGGSSQVSDVATKTKLTNLELEKTKIETRSKKLEDLKNREISKLRDDLTKAQKGSSTLKFENKILELKRMNKKSIDEAKLVSIQAKKLQQKLNHTQKQLDRFQKQKMSQTNDSSSSKKVVDTISLHKIKSLEISNEKNALQAKKAEKELILRKAEISKLKQELGTHKNKNDELSRKLAKNKKAA